MRALGGDIYVEKSVCAFSAPLKITGKTLSQKAVFRPKTYFVAMVLGFLGLGSRKFTVAFLTHHVKSQCMFEK